MKRTFYILLAFLVLAAIFPACRSKRCANFEDPNRNPHVKYNKHGLVKKKGRVAKPAWE